MSFLGISKSYTNKEWVGPSDQNWQKASLISKDLSISQLSAYQLIKNKINEIFISPVLSESERVLDVLSHEMIHAIDDCQSGHKGAFRKMAKAIGLEGKMTSTSAGEKLTEKLKEIISRIGNYPCLLYTSDAADE